MSDLVEVTSSRPVSELAYSPSSIRLYGRKDAHYRGADFSVKVKVQPGEYHTALIYGYSYQGHCYTLPEPTFIVLPRGSYRGTAVGCGFGTDYEMWVVEKLDTSAQLQLTADTFEQLILLRNLPGTRQPMSYAGKIAMLHRGGKLTE